MPFVPIKTRARSVQLDKTSVHVPIAQAVNVLQIRVRGVSMSTSHDSPAPRVPLGSVTWKAPQAARVAQSMLDAEAAPQLEPLKMISLADLNGQATADSPESPPPAPDWLPGKANLPTGTRSREAQHSQDCSCLCLDIY